MDAGEQRDPREQHAELLGEKPPPRDRIREQEAEAAVLLLSGDLCGREADAEDEQEQGAHQREELGVQEGVGRGEVGGIAHEGLPEALGHALDVALQVGGAFADSREEEAHEQRVRAERQRPEQQTLGADRADP